MRKAFLLRIDPDVLDDVQRWANDDLRSLNAQIECILRRALTDTGRGTRGGKRKKDQRGEGGGQSEKSRDKG
jgi:hypothetical protein